MGLLGDSWDDPRSMATLQLAAGLLSPGSFGQGLGRGLVGYQGSLSAQQEMAAKQQEMMLKNIALQQQTRMFNLQTPFLEEAVRRMQGGPRPTVVPSSPAPTGAPPSMLPSEPPQNAPQGSSQGVPQGSPQGQASSQPGGSMFPGVPDSVAFNVIGTGGFGKLPELIQKYNEPTEFVKTLIAAGIDPASNIGKQLIQNNLAKTNYVAPVNARPGSIMRDPMDPSKVLAFNPNMPQGTTPSFDANGNVVGVNPIPGVLPAEQAISYAGASGKAAAEPQAGFDPVTGKPAFTNKLAASGGNQLRGSVLQDHGQVSPEAQIQGIRESIPIMVAERDKTPPGPGRDSLDREIKRAQNAVLTGKPWGQDSAIAPAPPLGAAAAADKAGTAQQGELSDKWSKLSNDNSAAQTVVSRLQNIKQLAPYAITGAETQRRDYLNGILALGGFPKQLTAQASSDLIDKNAAQIATALRMGSNGTDALQSLVQSANPNRHMAVAAINEAVDQLVASQQMVQAKARTLLPSATARNANEYAAKEVTFDTNADPRIWQWRSITDPAKRKEFAAQVMKQDPSFVSKITALEGIGALK